MGDWRKMEKEGGKEGTMTVLQIAHPKGAFNPGVLLVNPEDAFAIKMYTLSQNFWATDISKSWTFQGTIKEDNVHRRLTLLWGT